MKILILKVLCVLFIVGNVHAKCIDYKSIESYVDSASILKKKQSFENLTKGIVKPDWDDMKKAYAIFYWISSNIKYDNEGLKNKFWEKYVSDHEIANDTYEFRKGVCGGYAQLFRLMCAEVGLQSKAIDGYSRINSYEAGLPVKYSNHSWNIVKVDGKWQLVDATWGNTTAGKEKINAYYFLTPPKEFIANHLPKDKEWQLLDNPISKIEFDNYPYISSEYFKSGFDKTFPTIGLIKTKVDTIKLIIKNPVDLDPLLKIYSFNLDKWITPMYNTLKLQNGTQVNIILQKKGNYLLQFDALNQRSESISIKQGLLYFSLIKE